MIWLFLLELIISGLAIGVIVAIPVFFLTEWGKEKFRNWNTGYKANIRKYGMSKNAYKKQQKKKLKY